MDVSRNEGKGLGKDMPRARIGCLPIGGLRKNVVSRDTENRGVACTDWKADRHAMTVSADEEASSHPREEVLEKVGNKGWWMEEKEMEDSEGMVGRLHGEVGMVNGVRKGCSGDIALAETRVGCRRRELTSWRRQMKSGYVREVASTWGRQIGRAHV